MTKARSDSPESKLNSTLGSRSESQGLANRASRDQHFSENTELSIESTELSRRPTEPVNEVIAHPDAATDSLGSKLFKYSKPLIALVLLYLLAKSGLLKVEQLKSSLQNANILIWGTVLLICQMIFFSARWRFLVNQHKHISLLTALRQSSLGMFFNFFIPGGVGGDFVKAMDLSRRTQLNRGTSFSLIFIDRILGLYAMIFFAFFFLGIETLISPELNLQTYILLSGLFFTVGSAGLFLGPQIAQRLIILRSRFLTDSWVNKAMNMIISLIEKIAVGITLRNLTWSVVLSFFAQLFSILFLYLVCQELAPNEMSQFSFLLFFPLACFGFMATAIPIAPGGIGLGQASFYLIFSSFNVTVANQLVIAVSLQQLFSLAFGLVGGLIYFAPQKRALSPAQR